MKVYKCIIFLLIVLFVSGCAANMPLKNGNSELDLSDRSIALVSIKISNKNKPGYQPNPLYAYFFPTTESGERTHIDLSNDPYKAEKEQYNEHLLSFSLKPGIYDFREIWGSYKIPLLINATCVLPIRSSFEIKPNSIVYLGHIDAVIRERSNDEEERAGLLIPLIDQAIAGFSNGTFDVIIKDRFDEDMKSYLSEYPVLQKYKIEKSILPPWRKKQDIIAGKQSS